MNPQFKKTLIVFSCSLIVISGVILLLQKQKRNVSQANVQIHTSEDVLNQQTETTSSYEAAVKKNLAPFIVARKNLSSDFDSSRIQKESSIVRTTHDAIVRIIVPSPHKDSHLALVLALTQIQQGMMDNNVGLWQRGEDAFDAFLKNNSWALGN